MRTSNRFGIMAAILAAPLLAMATPANAARNDGAQGSEEAKATCQRACHCAARSSAKADAGRASPDFFKATPYSPVP